VRQGRDLGHYDRRVDDRLRQRLEAALGRPVRGSGALAGGCVAQVLRVRTEDGPDIVVKTGGGTFEDEAFMLRYLRERTALPVPAVLHAETDMLVMEFVPGSSGPLPEGEGHAAELLADLHGHSARAFGFERATVIGPLPQPNPWTGSWREFFAEHRLRAMTAEALRHGRIPAGLASRLERAADACGRLLREPGAPALLHGDVWSGNVLALGGRVTAFLDPSIYYGHPEVELAFITLFGTFGPVFFDRYARARPIEAGFFETRARMYNLYPLLVHARLFGGAYPDRIERSLSEIGF
jgi:fructosamine-3-kinase